MHAFLAPITSFYIKIYFRKIYFSNSHKIPKDKPIIFAVNHPTAFLEPVLLSRLLKKDPYFMVRGDFFKKPFINALMRSIKLIPIFRMRDGGVEGLKKNEDTFFETTHLLSNNESVMILAEGLSAHEKRMRPILKGCGRMALKALEKDPDLDIYIVPVGVNYEDAEHRRTDILLQINDAIIVNDYVAKYDNNNKVVVELTKELSRRMREKIIHIEDPNDDILFEKVLIMDRSSFPLDIYPPVSHSSKRFIKEFSRIEQLNKFSSDQKSQLKSKVEDYYGLLTSLKISDKQVYENKRNSLGNWMILILGLLPAIIGFLCNFIPLKIGDYVVAKKVKRIEFKSPVVFGISMVLFIIIYGILFFYAALSFSLGLFLFGILAIFLGHFYLLFREYAIQFKKRYYYGKVCSVDLDLLNAKRKDVMDCL